MPRRLAEKRQPCGRGMSLVSAHCRIMASPRVFALRCCRHKLQMHFSAGWSRKDKQIAIPPQISGPSQSAAWKSDVASSLGPAEICSKQRDLIAWGCFKLRPPASSRRTRFPLEAIQVRTDTMVGVNPASPLADAYPIPRETMTPQQPRPLGQSRPNRLIPRNPSRHSYQTE